MVLRDGLYQVTFKDKCFGFEIRDGHVVAAADIYWKKTLFWNKHAVWIAPAQPSKVPMSGQQSLFSA